MTPIDWRVVLVRLIQLVLVGAISTVAIVAEVRPILEFLAGAGGGLLASKVFGMIRCDRRVVEWIKAPGWQFPRAAVAWLFFSPATAAAVVFGLGVAISAGASFVLSWATGTPLNEAWGALVSFVASQALFFVKHPAPFPVEPAPATAPTVVFTPDSAPVEVNLAGTAHRARGAPTDEQP